MNHQDRIRLLRKRLREAVEMADKADARWNRLNEHLNERLRVTDERRAKSRRPPMSDLAKVQIKNDNLELSDAFGVQAWWRAQAQYLASTLLAEVEAYKTLGDAE